MGLYDNIIFPKPIECNVCGRLHESTQTKMFSNLLVSYEVGDVLPIHIISGIVDEVIYCKHDGKQKASFDQKIYVVIWNNILIDVVGDLSKAEQKLENFGVTNLLRLYKALYKEKIDYEAKYSRLKSYCETYSEYLNWSKEKQEEYKSKQMKTFPTFSDMMVLRHLDKEHPLMGIIEELDEVKYDEKLLF